MVVLKRSKKSGRLRTQSFTKQELRHFYSRRDPLLDLTSAKEFLNVLIGEAGHKNELKTCFSELYSCLNNWCRVGMDRKLGHYREK